MKMIALVFGVASLILGGLWLVQGLGFVHVRPILCFAECAAIQGPSLTWAVISAVTLAISGCVIFWSLKQRRHARPSKSSGGVDD